MLRTLQNRLILSHLLPLLIIIPLTGIAFIYIMETRVILPGISDELITEGKLIAEFTRKQPELWQDQQELSNLMSRLKVETSARLMFLDPAGKLLASSDPADEERLGTFLPDDDIVQVQEGKINYHIDYSKGLNNEVIDVFAPVINPESKLIGIVRLSHPYTSIYDELMQMRLIILGILAVALIAGIGLGSFLAVTINTPIKQVTKAIDNLASGNELKKINQQGPEEILSLVNSTNSLYERYHHLEQARKQLLANLVHEIGRPLGALRSAIQSLKLGAGKDPNLLEELTTGMDEETARLQHLLNDLAHMHDQVFGTLEVNRKSINTKSWLGTMLRPWEEAAKTKGLKWQLEIPDDLSNINADPFRLAQAIENLVSNAIKYTTNGGSITISASTYGNRFWVKVSDTGPGISPDEREKIFTPFYRGKQKNRIKQGMGLGLSITRDVILAHGGKIDLESEPGKGTSFTISIPLI